MLHSSLQDIIREADETEYELFHFTTSQNDSPLGQGTLGRKEYRTATPLRTRRSAGKSKDEEPEIYLEAALRYLDRFHSIKPMPGTRAHLEALVERLDNVRNQVDGLQNSVQESQRKVPSVAQIQAEESAINELKVQISQLKKKKDNLDNSISSAIRQAQRPARQTTAASRSKPPRPQQSLAIPEKSISTPPVELNLESSASQIDGGSSSLCSPSQPHVNHRGEPTAAVPSRLDDGQMSDLQDEPVGVPMPFKTKPQSEDIQSSTMSTQEKRMADLPRKNEPDEFCITPEMDRICAKIWDTIADLLIPGNQFAHGNNIPNAKDTILILETISSQAIYESSSALSPKGSSPSTRSTLSSILGIDIHPSPAGVVHQIFTAFILLTLLLAPNHSIPLNTLKAQLASRTGLNSDLTSGVSKQASAAFRPTDLGSRAIYGCVAKKLIKIDRGGGGQVVKFD